LKEFKPNIDEVIERHRAYCRFEDADRPLLRIDIPLKAISYGISGIPLHNLDDWLRIVQLYEGCFRERKDVKDDFIPAAWANLGVLGPIHAFLGCPIEYKSGSAWSKPILHDWSEIDEIRFNPENEWFKKCLGLTECLVERAGDRYAVSDPIGWAPGDLAAALRGRENFIFDLYRHPEKAKQLLKICAILCIEIGDVFLEKVKHPYGGIVNGNYFNWMPGWRVGITQEDLTVYLSPKMYREFLKPVDEWLINQMDYTIFHNDGAWQITPELLKVEKLGILQLVDPPKGPRALDLEVLKKGRRKKPIMISCRGLDEIRLAIQTLGPRGLFIVTSAKSIKDANKLVESVEKIASKFEP